MHCLDTSKALGFAMCFIGILAECLVLYFMYSTHSHALTNTNIYTEFSSHFSEEVEDFRVVGDPSSWIEVRILFFKLFSMSTLRS